MVWASAEQRVQHGAGLDHRVQRLVHQDLVQTGRVAHHHALAAAAQETRRRLGRRGDRRVRLIQLATAPGERAELRVRLREAPLVKEGARVQGDRLDVIGRALEQRVAHPLGAHQIRRAQAVVPILRRDGVRRAGQEQGQQQRGHWRTSSS